MNDHNENDSTNSQDRLPWKGIAIGGVFLLCLLIAAPFIQVWVDNIPRYEQRPSIPLIAHTLTGDAGVVRIQGDGRFVAAALTQENYIEYFRLLEVVAHSEDQTEVSEAAAELERMYNQEMLLKLMSGAELSIIGGDEFIAQTKITSGRHAGAECWLSSEFIKQTR